MFLLQSHFVYNTRFNAPEIFPLFLPETVKWGKNQSKNYSDRVYNLARLSNPCSVYSEGTLNPRKEQPEIKAESVTLIPLIRI